MAVDNFEMIIKAVDEATKIINTVEGSVKSLKLTTESGAKFDVNFDTKGTEKEVGGLEKLMGSFGESFKAAGLSAGSAITTITSGLGSMLSPLNIVMLAFSPLIGIAKIFLTLLNPINLVKAALSAASAVVSTFVSVASAGFNLIKSVIASAFNAAIAVFNTFKNAISSVIGFVKTLFSTFSQLTLTISAAIQIIKDISNAFIAMGKAVYDAFSSVINTTADFEQQMSAVAAVTDATTEDMIKLRSAALDMGRTTSKTATESAQALYLLGQAGLNAEESMGALAGTVKLAEATGSELNLATIATVGTLKQFGLEVEESSRVANVYAAAVSNSMITLEDMTQSMKYAGPVAGALNVSLEDTTGILEVLANRNIKGSQAGTALRKSFTALITPSDRTNGILSALSLIMKDVNPETKSFAKILDTLNRAGITATQTMALFGLRAGPSMITLLKAGGDEVREYTEKVTGTLEAFRQAKLRLDNLRGSITLFKSAVEGVTISLGTPFQKSFTDIIRLATDTVRAFDAFITTTGLVEDATKVLTSSTNLLVTSFRIFGQIIATGKPALDLFAEGIVTIGEAFAESIIWVTEFFNENQRIQSIITVTQGYIKTFTDTASTQFDSITESIYSITEEFYGLSEGFSKAVGNIVQWISLVIIRFSDWVTSGEAVKNMVDAIAKVGKGFQNFLKASGELIKIVTGYMGKFTISSETFSKIVKTAGSIGEKAFDLIAKAIRTAISVHNTIVKLIPNIVGAYKSLKTGINSVIGVIRELIARYIEFITITEKGMTIDFAGALKKAFNAALDVIKTQGQNLLSAIEKLFDSLDPAKVVKSLQKFFNSAFTTLSSTISQGGGTLKPAILSIFNFLDGLANELSPKLDKFATDFYYQMETYLAINSGTIGKSIGESMVKVLEFISSGLDLLIDGMIALIEGKKGGAGSPSQILGDFFGGIGEKIKPVLTTMFQKVLTAFTTGWALLVSGIDKLIGGSGISSNLITTLKTAFETGDYEPLQTAIGQVILKAIDTGLSIGLNLAFAGVGMLLETVWNNLGTTAIILAKIATLITIVSAGLGVLKVFAIFGMAVMNFVATGIALMAKTKLATMLGVQAGGSILAALKTFLMTSVIAPVTAYLSPILFAPWATAISSGVIASFATAFVVGGAVGVAIGLVINSMLSDAWKDSIGKFVDSMVNWIPFIGKAVSDASQTVIDDNRSEMALKWAKLYGPEVGQAILNGEKISDVIVKFGLKTKKNIDGSIEHFKEIPKKVTKAAEDTAKAVKKIGDAYIDPTAASKAREGATEVVDAYRQTKKEKLDLAYNEVSNKVQEFGKLYGDPKLIEDVRNGATKTINAYNTTLIQKIADKKATLETAIRENVVDAFTKAEVIKERASQIGSKAIENMAKGIQDNILVLETAMTQATKQGLENPLTESQVKSLATMKTTLDNLEKQLIDQAGPMKQAANTVYQTIPDTIKEQTTESVTNAEDLANKTADGFINKMDEKTAEIEEKSKKIGKTLMEGIGKGIDEGKVQTEEKFGNTVDTMQKKTEEINKIIKTSSDGIAPAVGAALDQTAKVVGEKTDVLKQVTVDGIKVTTDLALGELSNQHSLLKAEQDRYWSERIADEAKNGVTWGQVMGATMAKESLSLMDSHKKQLTDIFSQPALSSQLAEINANTYSSVFGTTIRGSSKSISDSFKEVVMSSSSAVEMSINQSAYEQGSKWASTVGKGMTDNLASNKAMVKTAFDNFLTELNPDSTQMQTYGEKTAKSFINGMAASLGSGKSQLINALQNSIGSLMEAHSPPKEGPLSQIGVWGAGVGSTFMGELAKSLTDTSMMQSALGNFSDIYAKTSGALSLSNGNSIGAGGLSRNGLTTPALEVPGVSGGSSSQNVTVGFSGPITINDPMDAQQLGDIMGNTIREKLNQQRQRGVTSSRSLGFTR